MTLYFGIIDLAYWLKGDRDAKMVKCTFRYFTRKCFEFTCYTLSEAKKCKQPHVCLIKTNESDNYVSVYKRIDPEHIRFVTTMIIAHGNNHKPSTKFWEGDSHTNVKKIPIICISKESGDHLLDIIQTNKVQKFFCKSNEGGKYVLRYCLLILNP